MERRVPVTGKSGEGEGDRDLQGARGKEGLGTAKKANVKEVCSLLYCTYGSKGDLSLDTALYCTVQY